MGKIIDKLAWVQIGQRKVLMARTRGRPAWYLPGGKREAGESDTAALIREIREELSVALLPESVRAIGEYLAPADGQPEGTLVRLRCFTAEAQGTPVASAEIAELAQFGSADLPRCSAAGRLLLLDLVRAGLID
jgi:8-oxo-dGTP pyrophosphatase MutT (NUDIX family)